MLPLLKNVRYDLPGLLNFIPLAVLASMLFTAGYKLAKPTLFVEMYRLEPTQFALFIVTMVGIITSDLVKGVESSAESRGIQVERIAPQSLAQLKATKESFLVYTH